MAESTKTRSRRKPKFSVGQVWVWKCAGFLERVKLAGLMDSQGEFIYELESSFGFTGESELRCLTARERGLTHAASL